MAKRRSILLDTGEVAEEFRLKKHTLENMRSIGNGPIFRKHGGRVFYHRADLKRYDPFSLRVVESFWQRKHLARRETSGPEVVSTCE